MSALFLSILVASLAVASGFPDSRIVGGEDAPPGKYPFQISLRYNGGHTCGGTILNKRFILTAAHCVMQRQTRLFTVLVGTHLLNYGGQVYQVDYIKHGSFNGNNPVNDVAVVHVSRDIQFSEYVQPVVLSTYENLNAEYPGVAIGWGRIQHGGMLPNKLQQLYVTVINQRKCVASWAGGVNIQPSHICMFRGYGQGACNGDSGGPLLVNGKQVGIASFVSSNGCATGTPDVYTRVSAHLNWIRQNSLVY